jgi:eukaryotic-like serine/threonine-protein kinase
MTDRVGQQLGNYQLIHLLGEGGFAEVYLGEHIHLGTQAAIKVLHTQLASDDMNRFRAEAHTIAHLIHPHIVRVLEFGVEGKTPFLVMDYAPHGTLRQRHPKGVPLPLSTIGTYVKEIAEALQYAHDEKVIHRDIKPENMLLGRRYDILLSDFGIALVAQSSRYQSAQEMAGTMAYMAPEQIQGKPRPASDQYSLGIVVYEWLSGDRPFHGSLNELVGQHLTVPPPSFQERVLTIPPNVEQVVLKALAKDPHQRFARVQEFADILEQACQGVSPHPVVLATEASIPIQSSSPTDAATPPSEPLQITNVVIPPNQLSQLTVATTPSSASTLAQANSPIQEETCSVFNSQNIEKTTPMLKSGSDTGIITYRRDLPRIKIVLLITLASLIIASSVGVLSFIRANQITTDNTHMNTTTITHAAAGTPTTTFVAQVTSTVSAITALNPYGGNLVLDDPLRDNSHGYTWDENYIQDGACAFSGGAYHISALKTPFFFCHAETTDFSNLAFEVQLNILKGDCGGMFFRNDGSVGTLYFFEVCQDGSYLFERDNGNSTRYLAGGSSAAITTGLNQPNVLAVVAQGGTLTLYVNNQRITSVSDSAYSHGQIGLFANDRSAPTEVAFSNAKVWIL